ncbi:MAG: TIM barrel protein [Pseudomonadota bacterium]
MTDRNPIGLASGVLPGFDAEVTVEAAARAGFDAVGLWIEPDRWTSERIRNVRAAIAANGLFAVDAEVLRMRAGPLSDDHRRMVEISAEIGARNLLVIGSDPDLAGVGDAYAELCELGESHGIRIALEFMLFSSVRTLDDARAMVAATASPAAALLIDPLHLDRAGYGAADVAALPREWLPYAQFCDAALEGPARDDNAALLVEALDGREMPGEGVLALQAIVDALPPGIPLSVELRSLALRERFPDPFERAHALHQATVAWMDGKVAA